MSVELCVYVGPYFRATKVNKLVQERAFNTCPSPQCRLHGVEVGGKFCSECGSPVSRQGVRMVSPPSVREVAKLVENTLFDPLTYQYVYAPRDWGGRSLYFDVHEKVGGSPTELADETIREEKEFFQERYASEWATLKGVLGEGAVTVEWGIITYYC